MLQNSMKFRNFLLTTLTTSLASFALVSCAKEAEPSKPSKPKDPNQKVITPINTDPSNQTKAKDPNTSKEITIAIDGSLRNFYNQVIDSFSKTTIGKEYQIKTVSKDLWSALELAFNSKEDDQDNLDIIYMPSDYITLLANANKLAYLDEFDNSLFNQITAKIKASASEKEIMRQFGSVKLNDTSKLLGLVHNTEGLYIASSLPEAQAADILKSDETNTLVELITQGKMLLRFQDFWYSNGVFAGVFANLKKSEPQLSNIDLMKHILYTNPETNKVSSGFVISDKYNKHFKDALNVFTSLFFPIYQAAYIFTPEEYNNSVWGQKGISQLELKQSLSSNSEVANKAIFTLMKQGKIDFTVIGSWDAKNSQTNANAQSFFSIVKTNEQYEFLQAPGAWSFGISSRNLNASKERKEALKTFLNTIFEVASYHELFNNGTNIPFVKEVYNDLANSIKNQNIDQYNNLTNIAKSLGFETYQELKLNAFAKQEDLPQLSKLYNQATWGESWSLSNATNPVDKSNYVASESLKAALIQQEPNLTDEDFTNMNLGKILPLRNTIAALLGLENINDLKGKKFPEWSDEHTDQWLVSKSLLKITNIPSYLAYEQNGRISDESMHIRKIETEIFGINGDNQSLKLDLIDKLTLMLWEDKQNQTNKLQEYKQNIINKAQSFVDQYSKAQLDLEQITNIVNSYLNTYLNPALVRFYYIKNYKSFPNTVYTKEELQELQSWSNFNTWGESWSKNIDQTNPLAESNYVKASELKNQIKKLDSLATRDYDTLNFGDILPLRNAIAALLGLENVDLLTGVDNNTNQSWLVSHELLKAGSLNHPFASLMIHNNNSLHVRKIEEFIFGVDGDVNDSKTTFLQSLTQTLLKDLKAKNTKNLDQFKTYLYTRAQLFVDTFAKTIPTQDTIKQIVDGYLNTYLNPSKIRALIANLASRSSLPQGNASIPSDVIDKILAYEEKFRTNKTFNVFASDKSIAEGGLGITKTQPIRPDNSNPVFEQVWNIMNKEVFGNALLYQDLKSYNIRTHDLFSFQIANALHSAFSKYIKELNDQNKTTKIVVSN